MENVHDIAEQIRNLEKRLSVAIEKKEQEFFYKIHGRKVHFEEEARGYHKTLVTRIHSYIYNASLLNIVTAPLIWFCLVPALFMDLVASVYQAVCFPVYKIPKVRRSDYIVIDRHALQYLNAIEKLNCVYCGYFNGLIDYVREMAARTEQYWCPIKHARKIGTFHSRYKKFIDYGDSTNFRKNVETIRRDFDDLK